MKHISGRRALSFVLVLLMVTAMLPMTALAGDKDMPYTGTDSYEYGGQTVTYYPAYLILANRTETKTHYLWAADPSKDQLEGETVSVGGGTAAYVFSTNTLTLTNVNAPGFYINANMMGATFTVDLVGENSLGGILSYGWGYDGSVCITGESGSSLTLSGLGGDAAMDGFGGGIVMEPEGGRALLRIDDGPTVTVNGYDGGAAIRFLDPTTADPGIVIDGTLTDGAVTLIRGPVMSGTIRKDEDDYVNSMPVYTKGADYYGFWAYYSSSQDAEGNMVTTTYYQLYALTGEPGSFTDYAFITNSLTEIPEDYVPLIEDKAGMFTVADAAGKPLSFVEIVPGGSQAVVRPTITTSSLPAASLGSAYSATLTATPNSGGTITGFSLLDGTLPDGLSLNGSTISGKPTKEGTWQFTVACFEQAGGTQIQSLPRSLSIRVAAPQADLSGMPRTAVTGAAYSGKIAAKGSGGTPSYKVDGPYWLTADTETGILSGVPTESGAYAVSVTVSQTSDGVTVEGAPVRATIVVTDPVLTVTFDGAFSPTLYNELTLTDADDESYTYWVPDDVGAKGKMTLDAPPARDYTVTLTGSYNGSVAHTYATVESFTVPAGKNCTLDLKMSESALRVVRPTCNIFNYIFEWYDGPDPAKAKLLSVGSSFACNENCFVRAVPYGNAMLEYLPSEMVQTVSDAPVLTMEKREQYTVSAQLTDAAGRPLKGQVEITVTGSGDRQIILSDYKDNGALSVAGVPLGYDDLTVTAVFSAGERYESVTMPLGADDADLGNVVIPFRQGYITVPEGVAYGATFVIKNSAGQVIPASMSYSYSGGRDYRLYFDDLTMVGTNETLTVLTNESGRRGEVTVTLDGQRNAALTDITYRYGNGLRVTGTLTQMRDLYFMVYDSAGKPLAWWESYPGASYKGLFSEDGSFSREMNGHYFAGTYTVFVTTKEAYCYAACNATLAEVEESLGGAGSGLYVTKTVTLEDHSDRYIMVDVPLGTVSLAYPSDFTIVSAASGLTLDADDATVSARVTVQPVDTEETTLNVYLYTNQTSSGDETTPTIVNGSVYINGYRAGDEVGLTPNKDDHSSNFSGLYIIRIPDVNKYGGWPCTVQWQSYRTDYECVRAVALAAVGYMEKNYVGEGIVRTPAVSIYAPETVSDKTFSVYGNAPRNSAVRITLDGAVVATVSTGRNNNYSAMVTLDDPYSWEEHQVSALVTVNGATYTAAEKTVIYTPSLPTLEQIDVLDYSNTRQTLWDNGKQGAPEGYWYYLPDRPVVYYLTFGTGGEPVTDAAAVQDVIVHLPRGDDDVELTASYSAAEKAWVTPAYYCGANPPTGAWVEYTPQLVNQAPVAGVTAKAGTDYTPIAPEHVLTNNDFVKQERAEAANQAEWTAFFSGTDTALADKNLSFAEVKSKLGANGIILTDRNGANVREMQMSLDGVKYTVTNESKAGNIADVNRANREFGQLFDQFTGKTEAQMEQLSCFADADGENVCYPYVDDYQYTRLAAVDGVPTAVIIRRATSPNYTLWTRTTITPSTYTEESFNTKNGNTAVLTYKREGEFDLSESWSTSIDCYLSLIGWLNAMEQLDVLMSGGTAGSVDADLPAYHPARTSNTSQNLSLNGASMTVMNTNALGGTLPNGVHLSGDAKTAFYQMMVACIEQNIKLDGDGMGERWAQLEVERVHLGGGMLNNMLWKRGREFLKEVNKAKDDAITSNGAFVNDLIDKGVETACKKYVQGQIDGAYYSNHWGWIFDNKKTREKEQKQMKTDWDRLNKKLDELEKQGWKVDRSLLPPDPMPPEKEKDKDKAGGSGGETAPPEGPSSGGPGSSGIGQPGNTGPSTGPGKPGTPSTPSTPGGPGGPGTPPGEPPKSPGGGGIEIPKLYPPQVKLPVPTPRKPIIDPSGVVYEGVKSNRVQGVTATIYEVDDTGTRTPWIAEEYDQVNPYVTDENGFYQWMVPEGKWSVTFTKDGYDAYTTGAGDGYGAAKAGDTYYMPVAPAQLDVNINLQRIDPPAVVSATPTAEGVYIVFSQYMDASTLKAANFSVVADNEAIPFDVQLVNGEAEGAGTYASEVLLACAISGEAKVSLTVDRAVKSYTGKQMNANYVLADAEVQTLAQSTAPTVLPAGGEMECNAPVTITAAEGAKIYYTTDGSTPTRSSKLYTGPILVTADMTVKAIAVETGRNVSATVTAVFTVKTTEPEKPVEPEKPEEQEESEEPDVPVVPVVSGGTEAATYAPTITETKHGKVTVDPAKARSGETVTITITPDEGYELDTLTVTDANGKAVEVTKNADGTYSFKQPAGIVTIKATFKERKAAERPFTDVKETDWFYDAVYYCFDKGYFKGTGTVTFSPQETMTRAMFATVLWRIAGKPAARGGKSFNDVLSDTWYTEAVLWASGEGILNGYGDGTFGTNDPVTREQMVALLWRYSGKPAGTADLSGYKDADKISDWAKEAFAWAVSVGLVQGKGDGILDPGGRATRAEVAQIVMNYDTKIK